MQRPLPMIWTQVAVSISDNINISNSLVIMSIFLIDISLIYQIKSNILSYTVK